jgi:hypothetical protein
MSGEGITKIKLHKQEPAGLVTAKTPEEPIEEKKEDPDELGSEDFKEAADKAQVQLAMGYQTLQGWGNTYSKFKFVESSGLSLSAHATMYCKIPCFFKKKPCCAGSIECSSNVCSARRCKRAGLHSAHPGPQGR